MNIHSKTARTVLPLLGLAALIALVVFHGPTTPHADAAGTQATGTCTVTVADASPAATLTNNGPLLATTGKNVSGVAGALTWSSTNASSCTGTGFNTGGATSGTVPTGILAQNTGYSVSCSGAVANTLVTVFTPDIQISSTPTRVRDGAMHTALTWSSSLCTTVTVTGTNGFSSALTSAVNVDSLAIGSHGATFTATCDGGTASANVIVNVVPSFEEF